MYLYIIENSLNGTFYIGTTKNIQRRIEEHNFENTHYTGRSKGKWKLVFFKEFENEADARKEERRLKKGKNRNYLIWYINKKSLGQ